MSKKMFAICKNYISAIPKTWKILISKSKFDSNIPESNLTFRMGKDIGLIHISTLSTKRICRLLMKMENEPIYTNICKISLVDRHRLFGILEQISTFKIKNRIGNTFGHF